MGLRWLMIAGEGLLGLAFLLGFQAPYLACLCVIGVAAWINLLTGIATPSRRVLGDAEATAHLTLEVILDHAPGLPDPVGRPTPSC